VHLENEAGSVECEAVRLELIERPEFAIVRVRFGIFSGSWVTVATPAGFQARLMATDDYLKWNPLWVGRVDETPVEVFDPEGLARSRAYRLLLGAR
jgi:hypothetical protein